MKTTLPVVCVLIDDDIDDIEFFEIAVSNLKLPIEVIAFTDCDLAIDKLLNCEIDPHFIVLDSKLTSKTGHECLEKIKTKLDIKKTPVIILSGGLSIIEEVQYTEAGIYKSLKKQSTISELQTLLRSEFTTLFAFPNSTVC